MAAPSTPFAKFLHDNGLSLALFGLFVVCLAGQAATGLDAYNASLGAARLPPVGLAAYLGTGNFLDGIMSNWQAALLQLAVLITFGAELRQKGATHSRQPSDDERRPEGHSWIYAHSLGLAFAALFALTFVLHLVFGRWKYNEDMVLQHGAAMDLATYAASSSFWFTVFQCWEAEFAAIGLYIVASIYLRQAGSPESKPVEASDDQTGGPNE